MSLFKPITNLNLSGSTTIAPDNQSVYITEIDAQKRFARCGEPLIATVCSDHTIKLVGKDSMSSRGQLTGHSGPVSGVSFAHRNPFTVFSSSRDGTVRCWDTRMKRNKAPQVFTGYEGNSFTSFDINSTDDILSAGTEAVDNDAYLMFWDRRSTNLLGTYKESHSDDITQNNPFVIKQVKFHPTKSSSLATGSTDGLVCVFDTSQTNEEDALVTTLNAESSVSHIDWCGTNSEYLYCLTHTETIRIFDAVESSEITKFDSVRESLMEDLCKVDYLVDCFYHSGLKSLVVLGGTVSGDLHLLTVGRDRLHFVHSLKGTHKGVVRCLHWDDQTQTLITGGEDSVVSSWQPDRTANQSSTKKSTPAPTSRIRQGRRAEKRGSPVKGWSQCCWSCFQFFLSPGPNKPKSSVVITGQPV
ncbi:WD repeat-containing protein 89-like isoform X1 [Lytechinus variegatus]|uniref:WD repeat-containing protein 89-like isoform X1 n=1 Tax=Lytechinus variegatus TaxID=7654 RepID=UPI001BB28FCA|nr:WD repeat-containing protein 89-like isoform X1 [Lytechinus variegatus]